MKLLSKEEEEQHYNAVLKGGFLGGTAGFAIGLGGVMAASRRYPAVRGLTLPFRTFLVTSSATFGAIVNADRFSNKFARAREPMRDYKDASERNREMARQNESTYKRFMDWGRENRYSIVFTSWIASMGVAMAMVNRAPMSTAQKLVQARVYAQGLTLAVLIASAIFEVSDAKKGSGRWETVKVIDPNDPEHKHLIEKKIHKEEYEGQDLWMGKFFSSFYPHLEFPLSLCFCFFFPEILQTNPDDYRHGRG
jgi:hypothetical protein